MGVRLYHADAFDLLEALDDKSIEAIIFDPPYNTTGQSFDVALDFVKLWHELDRVADDFAPIIIFTQQPFTTDVMVANRMAGVKAHFGYEIIMHKTHAQGFMNARRMPLKAHENVLLFYKRTPYYNPQFTEGKPYKVHYKRNYSVSNYGSEKCGRKGTTLENDGYRFPTSVHTVSNPNMKAGHPQGKPVPYLQYLLRQYTKPDYSVLDPTCGGGSLAMAVMEEGNTHDCICGDDSSKWIFKTRDRIEENYGKRLKVREI